LLSADTKNLIITVQSLIINVKLTVDGHIITGGSAPGIAVGANAGTGASVSITGNDEAGTMTVTTGTGSASGTLATITFASAYGATPNIELTPVGNTSATIEYSVGTVNSNNFTLGTANAPADGNTYNYAYHVEQ
jgi:hypothetical protein